ncbi:hypothetical protein Rrhod_0296 [Rhodococcus rhodnii LMG 5362]|uniref:Uncharacterized protein n=1 Tax=Rhodococcus rhodnii LMG 5362 TaxID=1273125 RepID=R7WWE5_9NOCA|nr:hypothetical protein Rrhod_0296 [Rhodococcus rhodnii LMG 5362]
MAGAAFRDAPWPRPLRVLSGVPSRRAGLFIFPVESDVAAP